MQTYCNNTTAEFGIWFNGGDIVYQHRKREPHQFDDIPDIPRKGETLDDVGSFSKDDLIPATELKSVFETIHNNIYANEGFLKERAFNEMLKIIFIKMVDEKSAGEKSEFRITERELRAVEEGKGKPFVERITNLFTRVKREYGDVFSKTDIIDLKPTTLAFVVSRLQKYNLRDTPADVKGTAFQTFVYAHQRGDRGEFFTPHPILELMVEMLDPGDAEMLLDPACGSGGFLVYGMNHVWGKFRKRKRVRDVDLLKYAHNYIRGIDFNPDLAKVAKMHLVLYDDGHTGVFSANALEDIEQLKKHGYESGVLDIDTERFDIILTNPPFGGKGKVTDKRIIAQYDLAYKWKFNKKTNAWERTKKLQSGQVPDILFIERCLQLLRTGGRLGIVLPNSDLNNLSLEYVRQYIKDRARILAVVSLPVGTFMSAGSNPQPSILFLQKLEIAEAARLNATGYPIFMASITRIGYDLNTKTAPVLYKKNQQGELLKANDGKAIIDTDGIPRLPSTTRNTFEVDMFRQTEVSVHSLTNRLDVVYYLIREAVVKELGTHPATPLGELCVPIRTKTPPREAYVAVGVPCIKLRNVTGQMLNLANCAHIPERFKERFVAAKKNDIIVTATGEGTAGRADIFLESETYIVTGENILLRPKMDSVNPFYLLAMLRTDHVAKQLTRFVRGATGQTHLYWQDIASIQIPNADSVTQKACEVLFMKGADLRQKSDEQLGLFKTKGESVLVESSSVESASYHR